MTFNAISKSAEDVSVGMCDAKRQKEILIKHGNKDYWTTEEADEYLLVYAGPEYCIYIKTIENTQKASKATAARQFLVAPVLDPCSIGLGPNKPIVGADILDWIEDRSVVMATRVKEVMVKVRLGIVKMLESPGYSGKISQAMQYFDDAETTLQHHQMKIGREIQFTTWLFQQLHKILTPLGFTVEPEKENKCTIPNICEFSRSITDCVIYHEKSFCQDSMNGLSVILDTLNDDGFAGEDYEVLDDSNDLFGIDVHKVCGQAFEVKVKELNEAAITQCFYNMHGSGTRLAGMVLKTGKIVNKIVMYGLVSVMKDPTTAKILKLEMNFITGECHYNIVAKKYSFLTAMNVILTKLQM